MVKRFLLCRKWGYSYQKPFEKIINAILQERDITKKREKEDELILRLCEAYAKKAQNKVQKYF